MRPYLIILITFTLIIGAIKLCAQTANSDNLIFPGSFLDAQKELITTNLSEFPKNTQISIAVIKGGKTEYLGIKNKDWKLENEESKDSVFEIGSISKVMTSALLANAILSGDVSLSTEISELLGYPLLKEGKITMKAGSRR